MNSGDGQVGVVGCGGGLPQAELVGSLLVLPTILGGGVVNSDGGLSRPGPAGERGAAGPRRDKGALPVERWAAGPHRGGVVDGQRREIKNF